MGGHRARDRNRDRQRNFHRSRENGSPRRLAGSGLGVWIFGGLLTLFGALTYAELSAALPDAGGEYVYLTAAYGPFWGFIYGWTQTWVAKSASIATLATGFFNYVAFFFPKLMVAFYAVPLPIGPEGKPLEIQYGQLLGISLILFLAGINYLGVRLGGQVQIIVTAVKLGLIGALIVAGLTWGGGSVAHFSGSIPANPGGVSGFFAALVAALWAYDGWNNAGMLGSEIENPQRNLPRALLVGTSMMIAIYLLTNLAYFYGSCPAPKWAPLREWLRRPCKKYWGGPERRWSVSPP